MMPFVATRMDLQINIQTELRQTQKDICHMIITQHMKEMRHMNLYTNRNRFTDTESKLMVIEGGQEGERNQEFGVGIDTQLYIKWITNQDLLNSIGNCIQYSVITYKIIRENVYT